MIIHFAVNLNAPINPEVHYSSSPFEHFLQLVDSERPANEQYDKSHLSFTNSPGQVCDDYNLRLIEGGLGNLFSLSWGFLISQEFRLTSVQNETNLTDLALWCLRSSDVGSKFVLNLDIWLLQQVLRVRHEILEGVG